MGRSKPKLTNVTLTNVGSVGHAQFDVAEGMTVLVGLNGSGKSSVMQGLGLPGRIATDGLEGALANHSGGFAALRTLNSDGPMVIRFDFESGRSTGHYEMALASDKSGKVSFSSETASFGSEHFSRAALPSMIWRRNSSTVV